jgi:hypothetical protein
MPVPVEYDVDFIALYCGILCSENPYFISFSSKQLVTLLYQRFKIYTTIPVIDEALKLITVEEYLPEVFDEPELEEDFLEGY